jgi:hypothetical protein
MLISAANAREMAARSHESRRARTLLAKTEGLDPAQTTAAIPADSSPALEDFALRRLARLRKQLDRLDAMVEGETDPQRLERLASAGFRLAEQERVLANRPLPGSRRPPPQKENLRQASGLLD